MIVRHQTPYYYEANACHGVAAFWPGSQDQKFYPSQITYSVEYLHALCVWRRAGAVNGPPLTVNNQAAHVVSISTPNSTEYYSASLLVRARTVSSLAAPLPLFRSALGPQFLPASCKLQDLTCHVLNPGSIAGIFIVRSRHSRTL